MSDKPDEVKVTLEDIRKMPDVENQYWIDLGELGIDINPVRLRIEEERNGREC